MKKAILVVALLALLETACVGQEIRGVWVTSWSRGFITADEADATIAAAKKAGMNALFVEVRKCADAYYYSRIEPRAPEIEPGFDPLGYIIKKAHAEGMQVHAWVVIYRAYSGPRSGPTDPNHIVNKHPEWVLLSDTGRNYAGEGIYLDPGIPEVREYIASVLEDLVKRYNVDGVQYDYVRYPGRNWGYSELALKHYYADTGATEKPRPDDPKWLQWRRDQVTAFVKLARDKMKAVNPNIQISASTICYGNTSSDWTKTEPYAGVLQDWKLWMEKGYIDINIPMNYRSERSASAAKAFRTWVINSERWSGGRPVLQGIYASSNPPEDVIKQIEFTRKAGQEGFVIFAFNQGRRRDSNAEVYGAALGIAPRLAVNEPPVCSAMKE